MFYKVFWQFCSTPSLTPKIFIFHWFYKVFVSLLAKKSIFHWFISFLAKKVKFCTYAKIFLGFGHPAVVTVAAVLVISTAMKNSGVVDFLSRKIKPYISKQAAHISGLSFLIAILSGFMNNVGALALMLPVT